MKKIAYHQGKCFAEYEIFDGNKCIFSGVTPDGRTTINSAEEIIKIITAEESGKQLKFYDLQTHKGYSHYAPGEYDFCLLVFHGKQDDPDVYGWDQENLPQRVLDVFREHIGDNLRRKY